MFRSKGSERHPQTANGRPIQGAGSASSERDKSVAADTATNAPPQIESSRSTRRTIQEPKNLSAFRLSPRLHNMTAAERDDALGATEFRGNFSVMARRGITTNGWIPPAQGSVPAQYPSDHHYLSSWQQPTGVQNGVTMARHGYPAYHSTSVAPEWPRARVAAHPEPRRTSTSSNPPPMLVGSSSSSLPVMPTLREEQAPKQLSISSPHVLPPTTQRPPLNTKELSNLNLLCSTTINFGQFREEPAGCSCPINRCITLYCACFKAGRHCDPALCACVNCKNSVAESGIGGARTKAIRSICKRNPRAFAPAGTNTRTLVKPPPGGEAGCSCTRSRCLKLYCTCFQGGRVCRPNVCACFGCLNTEKDDEGHRQAAIQRLLERRPNAFEKKPKEHGLGCACKKSRCILKYCECFRTNLPCTDRCSCLQCENRSEALRRAEPKS